MEQVVSICAFDGVFSAGPLKRIQFALCFRCLLIQSEGS